MRLTSSAFSAVISNACATFDRTPATPAMSLDTVMASNTSPKAEPAAFITLSMLPPMTLATSTMLAKARVRLCKVIASLSSVVIAFSAAFAVSFNDSVTVSAPTPRSASVLATS